MFLQLYRSKVRKEGEGLSEVSIWLVPACGCRKAEQSRQQICSWTSQDLIGYLNAFSHDFFVLLSYHVSDFVSYTWLFIQEKNSTQEIQYRLSILRQLVYICNVLLSRKLTYIKLPGNWLYPSVNDLYATCDVYHLLLISLNCLDRKHHCVLGKSVFLEPSWSSLIFVNRLLLSTSWCSLSVLWYDKVQSLSTFLCCSLHKENCEKIW